MNIDTIAGEGTVAKGRVKESLGVATGDPLLERDGVIDQMSGSIRQAFGGIRDFVRYQPVAAAVIAAAVGALFFRGGRRRRAR
jgi:uncharacterized protein YjbJ (UPF0337 family)